MVETQVVRNLIRWVIRIIVLVVAIKLGLWLYQEYLESNRTQQVEVSDIDKVCVLDGDSGQCICRHRRTQEWLSIPYEECVSRARAP